MSVSQKVEAELRKYKEGTKVKCRDIVGVVQADACAPYTEDVWVEWETGQCYSYTREWLDANVEVIR